MLSFGFRSVLAERGRQMTIDVARRIARREFVAGLGSTAAWPLAAKAQQPKVPVIGYLSPTSPSGNDQTVLLAVHQGLRDTGFVEGQNLIIEYRWAEGQLDR